MTKTNSKKFRSNDLHLDPLAMPIGAQGLENFYWPVSRAEMEQFRDEVQSGILKVLRTKLGECGSDWPVVRILCSDMILDAMRIFQAVAVRNRAACAGRCIQVPHGFRLYTALERNESPSPRTNAWLLNGKARPPSWKLWLRMLRSFVPGGAFSRRSVKYALAKKTPVALSIAPFMERHAEHVMKTTGRRVVLRSLWEWFVVDENDRAAIKNAEPINADTLNVLLTIVQNAFTAHEETLPPKMHAYLADWITEASKAVRFFHDRLLEDPESLPGTLWYGSTNHVWTRILRSATQANGGVCVGHDHGRGIGLCPNYGEHGVVLDLCDDYVSYSPFLADRFEAFNEVHSAELIYPENIRFSAVSDIYPPAPELRKSENGKASAKQKVMYVAPLWLGEDINLNCLPADAVYADWQVRLFAWLSSRDNRIIYKAHPEGLPRLPKSITQNKEITLVTEYIEEQHTEADVFLVDFLSSSFRTIVFTSKPIVFIDFGFGTLSEDAGSVLSKRCAIIEGWFDKENRAHIDWDQLEEALRCAPERAGDTSCARLIYGGSDG